MWELKQIKKPLQVPVKRTLAGNLYVNTFLFLQRSFLPNARETLTHQRTFPLHRYPINPRSDRAPGHCNPDVLAHNNPMQLYLSGRLHGDAPCSLPLICKLQGQGLPDRPPLHGNACRFQKVTFYKRWWHGIDTQSICQSCRQSCSDTSHPLFIYLLRRSLHETSHQGPCFLKSRMMSGISCGQRNV